MVEGASRAIAWHALLRLSVRPGARIYSRVAHRLGYEQAAKAQRVNFKFVAQEGYTRFVFHVCTPAVFGW